MKQKLFSLIALVIMTGAVLVTADNSEKIEAIMDNITSSEISESFDAEEFEAEDINFDSEIMVTNDFGSIKELLLNQNYYYDEIKTALSKYASILITYDLDSNSKNYLLDLAEKGYDFSTIMDIYDFVQMTDCGISAVAEIYNNLSELDDPSTAIEAAYARRCGTLEDELSISDVAYYVNNGITTNEIIDMYEITLKGEKTLRQALDERINGRSWCEIVSESYGKPLDFFGECSTTEDIVGVKVAAQKCGKSISKIINIEDGRAVADTAAMEIYYAKMHNLINIKSDIGKFENLDVLIEEQTNELLNEISYEQADALMKSGYTLRTLKKAEDEGLIDINENGVPTVTEKLQMTGGNYR